MKRAASILLVVLLMLNVMGYYGLFMGLKYKNTISVRSRLDAHNYRDSETVTIKIPLSIPYYGDTEFERVDGEIEHEGQFYRLVKQKLEKDTLHVVCIRDTRAKRIHEALTDYVHTFADQSAEGSGTRIVPSFIKDYFPATFSLSAGAAGWTELLLCDIAGTSLPETFLASTTPPPRFW